MGNPAMRYERCPRFNGKWEWHSVDVRSPLGAEGAFVCLLCGMIYVDIDDALCFTFEDGITMLLWDLQQNVCECFNNTPGSGVELPMLPITIAEEELRKVLVLA